MKKDSTRTGASLCSSMRPRSATTSWLNKFKLLALVLMTVLSINVWGETSSATIVTSEPYGLSGDGWSTNVTKSPYTGNYLKLDANEKFVLYVSSSIAITKFDFTYKNQTGTTCTGHSGAAWSAGSISVFVTTNGTSFTELPEKEIEWSGSTATDHNVSLTFNQASNYVGVKIVFNKDCGNLGIKNLQVTYSPSTPSITYTDISLEQKSGQFRASFLALSQIVILGFFAFFCKKVFHIRCTEGAWRMHIGSLPSIQPLFLHFGTLFAQPPFFLLTMFPRLIFIARLRAGRQSLLIVV